MVTEASMSAQKARSPSQASPAPLDPAQAPHGSAQAFVPTGPDGAAGPREASPFPTLHPDTLLDPLQEPPQSNLPERATRPPPLPRAHSSHLRLVSSPPRSSASEGRAFGTNPPRGPTPPPARGPGLNASLDDWAPPLRRPESVIEEAESLRNHRAYQLKKAWAQIAALWPQGAPDGTRALVSVARRLGEATLSVLHRFERLPRRMQVLAVAAPYLAAMGLVAYLLSSRGQEPTAPTVALVVAAPEAAIAPVVPVPAAPPADAAPVAAVVATPPQWVNEPATLPRASRLFVRADARAKRPIPLRAGTELTVFTSFPAPEGWRLVQTKKGTVGFVSTLHLDDKDDPNVEPRAQPRRRRRR